MNSSQKKQVSGFRLLSLTLLALLTLLFTACSSGPAEPDLINITGPADGATVSQDTVTVTGVLEDGVTSMNYRLNGGQVWPVEFANNEYAFPVTGLVEGENRIEITVGDADGVTVVIIIIIIFDPGAGDDVADTFYVSNNGPQNAGEVDTFDEDYDLQDTFFSGNNEGVEIDRFGDLYHAGDGANGPSIRIITQFFLREDGSYDPDQDREIMGDQTGLVAPKGIEIAEEDNYILVADFGADPGNQNLKVFNTSDDGNVPPVATTSLSVKPWDLVYDEESDRLFVSLTDGTVAVFDRYIQQGFGTDGPDTIITPADRRGNKISDNLHGIDYDKNLDALVLTDVGDAAVNDDGAIYVIHDASDESGNVIPGRVISGQGTMLGNPVDVIINGTEARVMEKARDQLLVFENIFFGRSGDVEPDLAVNEMKPESIVAAMDDYDDKPGRPDRPDNGFDSDFDLNVYVSNNGMDNVGEVDKFDENFDLQSTFFSGNNEGVELDGLGNLYHAGDVEMNNGSIRVIRQIRNRDDGSYTETIDREIQGDQTGLVAPKGIDIALDAGFLIVADFGAGNLKVFGTAADGNVAPVATTSLDVSPWDVSYDEDNDRLFVSLTDGTVAVFEGYLGRDDDRDGRDDDDRDGDFGSNGPDRIITPVDDGGNKISTNLHGIFYVDDRDSLVVTDVGDAGVDDDGSIYVFNDLDKDRDDGDDRNGSDNVQPDRVIRGPATMLGNPVDIIVDGSEARVAEKARDMLLVFDNIFDGEGGNVAPDLAVDETKPESLVSEADDFRLTNPDVTDIDDADIMIDAVFATSNTPDPSNGSVNDGDNDAGDDFVVELDTDLSSRIRAAFDTRDATANPENITFSLSGDAYLTFDNGVTPSQGGILVVNRLADSRDGGMFDASRDRTITGDQTGLVAPKGLDIASTQGVVIVADFGAQNIKVFSTEAGGNVAPLYVTSDLGSDMRSVWDLDYDPTNDRLFVAATDGTVLVYDDYVDSMGAGGPDRVITPTNGNSKVSVNLHGVVHVSSASGYSGDVLILSDVGDAASNSDGQLFIIDSASTANGNVAVTAQIGGPRSTLGNPVDITFDGEDLYVAEKTKDTVLRFDDILNQQGMRDVSPDRSVTVDNVESVALAPDYLSSGSDRDDRDDQDR